MVLVRDVMNKNVVIAKPEVTIKEAASVMSKLGIGSLVIVDNEKIVGLLTNDLIMKAVAESKDVDTTLVEELMIKKVVTIEPDKKIEDAVNLMVENKIKKIPVVEENKLIGMITASDIVVVEPKLIASIASLISLNLPGYKGG